MTRKHSGEKDQEQRNEKRLQLVESLQMRAKGGVHIAAGDYSSVNTRNFKK